jgi:hypothetical protein
VTSARAAAHAGEELVNISTAINVVNAISAITAVAKKVRNASEHAAFRA